MKRLIFSDLHLHPWNYGAGVNSDGFNTRLFAQWAALKEMVDEAQEQGIKYAYFLGDLFQVHGNVPTQALIVAADLFSSLRKAGIKIRAIAGNHDSFSRTNDFHALSWLPQDEISGRWEDDGLLVQALPYTDSQETLEGFLEVATEHDSMLMLHQGVAGVPLSSGYVLDEKLSPGMIPSNVRAFTGHYHFHRAVSPNLTVVGNLTPLNWGDIDQQKGWVYWDDQTGVLSQRVQNRTPGFMSFSDGMDVDLVRGNFVRYTTPVKAKEIEGIRQDLIKEGALTVEFPVLKIDVKQDKMRAGHDVLIEHVKQVMDQDMQPRRKEVGEEIREERYVAN